MNMFSLGSFLTLSTLTIFYLSSQTKATLDLCQEPAIKSAVDCGCFLYRPLYESNPIWDGLEDLCLEELSGNIQAGNSSCESAPFDVSSQGNGGPVVLGVPTASLESANEYFEAVRRSCEDFEEADRRLREAERRLEEAHERLEVAKRNGTADDVAQARRNKFSTGVQKKQAEVSKRIAKDRRKFAEIKRRIDIQQAKVRERIERHRRKMESRREMSPAVHVRKEVYHRFLANFCLSVTHRRRKKPEEAVAICCPT